MKVETPLHSKVKLLVFPIINETHSMYGLRHRDYKRYRKYCSRKVATLRSSLNLKQGSKKAGYNPRKINPDLDEASHRILLIPLFNAERCWSHAMEIKQSLVDDPRKRHHMIKRFNKAASYSKELLFLAETWNINLHTLREIKAYNYLLNGHACFEKQDHKNAISNYIEARNILELLSDISGRKRFAPYNITINSLNPNISYCAYNLTLQGLPTGIESISLDPRPVKAYKKKIHKKKANKVEKIVEIKQEKMNIDNEKSTSTTVTKDNKSKSKIDKIPKKSKKESKNIPEERLPITSSLNDEVDNYDDSEDDFLSADDEDVSDKKEGWLSMIWGKK